MSPHRLPESFASFIPAGGQLAVIVQGKLRIDRERLVLKTNYGVHNLTGGKAVLGFIISCRNRIAEKAFQRDFAQSPARLGSSQDGLQGLRGRGKFAARLLHLAELLL